MADYTARTVRKAWREFVLTSPTNGAEFAKAMAGAEREYERFGLATWDNTFEVVAGDDEIIIRFELPKEEI